ncbi:MAG: choline dehydrogenase [Cellulomonadaceae bacterium]|nr:choline dehydrogenase [Cellulomonadaceae bacterium]
MLIVGSGLLGAAVARMVRDASPTADIVMVSGGPRIGQVPGQHLHDSPEPHLRARFARGAAQNQQDLYVGARLLTPAPPSTLPEPGMHSLSGFGSGPNAMPGAAVAWNEGGMGVHWAAGCPEPGSDEVPAFLDDDEWRSDVLAARRLLGVQTDTYPTDDTSRAVIAALEQVGGLAAGSPRGPGPLPMAIRRDDEGLLVRTGPNRIFPALATGCDEHFELVVDSLCVQIVIEDGRAVAGLVRPLSGGPLQRLDADHVVVAADALRTPQLLYASGIRPEALGRRLNEHAFIAGSVVLPGRQVDRPRAAPGPGEHAEPFSHALWFPYRGVGHPYHGTVLCRPYAAGPPGSVLATLTWYVPTDIAPANRVHFSQDASDAAGMPQMSVDFARSDADLARIGAGRREMDRVITALGGRRDRPEPQVLAPGSSLHYTGTVRMGATDDGTSVCDTDGRVWGLSNTYVVGTGVVPTALAANSTLTATVLAVRTARALGRDLPSSSRA